MDFSPKHKVFPMRTICDSRLSIEAGPCVEAFSTAYPDLMPEFADCTLILPQQTHTANVAVVEDFEGPFFETDALITLRKDVAIGIRTADCVPILLNAPDIRAIAAVHAGWKGTIARIAEKAVEELKKLGADPGKMYAAMGPCICADCYEVSPDLARSFAEAGFSAHISGSILHPHLDLPAINRTILQAAGIQPDKVHLPEACTKENTGFPSWRRVPQTHDRLITVIRLTRIKD